MFRASQGEQLIGQLLDNFHTVNESIRQLEQALLPRWLVGPCRPRLERDLEARLTLKGRAERGY
ncbi:hypothetical protein [Roseivivax sp. CAU 1761]